MNDLIFWVRTVAIATCLVLGVYGFLYNFLKGVDVVCEIRDMLKNKEASNA